NSRCWMLWCPNTSFKGVTVMSEVEKQPPSQRADKGVTTGQKTWLQVDVIYAGDITQEINQIAKLRGEAFARLMRSGDTRQSEGFLVSLHDDAVGTSWELAQRMMRLAPPRAIPLRVEWDIDFKPGRSVE